MNLPSKKILRLEAIEKLTHLSIERRQKAALAAFSFITTYHREKKHPILSFASTALEINMWPINDYLIKEKSLFLPRHENGTLSIYEVESKEELITSSFGLHEPDPTLCRKIDPEEISLILVPALYFDVLHHRLGYGKGLFDKFLSSFIKIPKWGIGFKEQKIEKIPNEDHDIQLDNVFLF